MKATSTDQHAGTLSGTGAATLDRISISGLEVDCVIGVYAAERERAQPLRIDLELALDTRRSALSECLEDTIDYEFLAAQVTFILKGARFCLLETAAHALTRYLLAPPPPGKSAVARAQHVALRLTKPHALGGRALPALQVERSASEVQLGVERRPFGTVDVIHETSAAGIYRLNLAPSAEIPLHVHRRMSESEMVLGRGLLCQEQLAERGSIRHWRLGSAHSYRNPTDGYESILCIDRPPFVESDEVVVSGTPDATIPSTGGAGDES